MAHARDGLEDHSRLSSNWKRETGKFKAAIAAIDAEDRR